MKDFGERHRGIVHFGLWAEDSADDYGQLDALKILEAAAQRTYYEDARGQELDDALAFLKAQIPVGRLKISEKRLMSMTHAKDITEHAMHSCVSG